MPGHWVMLRVAQAEPILMVNMKHGDSMRLLTWMQQKRMQKKAEQEQEQEQEK